MSNVTESTTTPSLIQHPSWCQSREVPRDADKERLMYFNQAPAEASEQHVGQELQLDCGPFDWTVRVAAVQSFERFPRPDGPVIEYEALIRLEVGENAMMSDPSTAYLTPDEARHLVAMLEHGLRSLDHGTTRHEE